MRQPHWKAVWQFLTKLNIPLPYDPVITLFGIYPKELKNICPYKNLLMDVYSSFINNSPNLEGNWDVPSVGECIKNCITSRQWNIIQHWKEMNYQAMKRHRKVLNVYYWVKEVNLKSLHMVWFQLHDNLEKAKVQRKLNTHTHTHTQWLPEIKGERGRK